MAPKISLLVLEIDTLAEYSIDRPGWRRLATVSVPSPSTKPARYPTLTIANRKPTGERKQDAGRSMKVLRPTVATLALLGFPLRRLQVELEVLFLHFTRGEDLARLELKLL